MNIKTRQKTTSTVKEFINWAELSKHLTNGSDRIRKNRIPKMYESDINELLNYIECWKQGKKLFSVSELDQAIDKIDLKTIITDKIGLVY